MASPKKSTAAPEKDHRSHELEYKEALASFTTAVELLNKKDWANAREAFLGVESKHRDELALSDRARVYARICDAQMLPALEAPVDFDGLYHRAVLHTNNGEYDEALGLLERALAMKPDSPQALYARASAWALKGNAEAAVADLRRAISAEPSARYQAANDPDFERIREEPSFIDIIEPTPAGG